MLRPIFHFGGWLVFERPAKRYEVQQLGAALQINGEEISEKLVTKRDTAFNCGRLRHIIGIERWGQARLRVALGERFIDEEYDGYQPAPSLDYLALIAAFDDTRSTTVELAETLAAKADTTQRIKHNQWGDLSVKGWLRYLDSHANLTAMLIR